MNRRARILAALALLSTAGCRSFGQFPGVDVGDYAYIPFNGTVNQIYQYTVPQVESSALQALGDLGFTKMTREQLDDGVVLIKASTPDCRPTCVWIRPQNNLTKMSIRVGLIGDELTSEAVTQRVSINFGALPRFFIPNEPTLSERIDRRVVSTLPSRITIPPPPIEDPLAPPAVEVIPPIGAGAPRAPGDAEALPASAPADGAGSDTGPSKAG